MCRATLSSTAGTRYFTNRIEEHQEEFSALKGRGPQPLSQTESPLDCR
jgi:hypothetical protein